MLGDGQKHWEEAGRRRGKRTSDPSLQAAQIPDCTTRGLMATQRSAQK